MKEATIKIYVLTFLGFFGSATYMLSQPQLDWVKSHSSIGNVKTVASDIDSYGNVLCMGYFEGAVILDPSAPSVDFGGSEKHLFVQKIDVTGQIIWTKTFYSSGGMSDGYGDIVCDQNGNVFLYGSFSESINFPSGNSVSSLYSGDNLFYAKLNVDGDVLFAKSFSSPGNQLADKIIYDEVNDELFGTGSFTGSFNGTSSAGGRDGFIVKMFSNVPAMGLIYIVGGIGNDEITDLIPLANGSLKAVGFFSDGCDFRYGAGVTSPSNSGSTDCFILNISASYNFLNVKVFGGTGSDEIRCISSDGLNNYIIGGIFSNTVDFDPNVGVNNISAGSNNGFVSNFDLADTYFGSSTNIHEINDIEHFDSGFGYSGTTGNKLQFGKYDNNLVLIWSQQLNPVSTSTSNQIVDLTVDYFGHMYMSGFIESMTGFDSNSGSFISSAGNKDGFIMKIRDCIGTNSIINVSACSSYSAPDGQQYSNDGQYIAVIENVAGCDSIITINLIIEDVEPPVPDVTMLSDVSGVCTVTSLTFPTATDVCAGSITGISNATLPITSTSVITWTYNDGNGNISTQTQNVVIDDITAPVANVASLANVTSECSVTSLTAPTATDNCAGSITGTHNTTLPITNQGTTTVTWTYNDGNGNTSTQTQNVVIDDITAPIANVASLANVTSECSVTSLTAPTATDNCAGSITGTHNATLPITNQGTTIVTWTYNDGNGNTSIQTQDVVITPIDNGISLIDVFTLSADVSGYMYQWIDCNNGNQAIDGETNQTFIAENSGNYAVEISNGNCSVTSDCMSIMTVGLAEDNKLDVSVYPNPTTGQITIRSKQGLDRIQLTNSIGQTVIEHLNVSETDLRLELPDPAGVYLLLLEVDGIIKVTRVVKY